MASPFIFNERKEDGRGQDARIPREERFPGNSNKDKRDREAARETRR